FTASPQWQKFIASDPLALREATARFLLQSARFDMYLKLAASRVRVPVLLQLAGKDQIIDNVQTQRFAGRFGHRPVRVVAYGNRHHRLEFEPAPHAWLDDLCAWIDTTSQFLNWRR